MLICCVYIRCCNVIYSELILANVHIAIIHHAGLSLVLPHGVGKRDPGQREHADDGAERMGFLDVVVHLLFHSECVYKLLLHFCAL
jgi:hypothetical protein